MCHQGEAGEVGETGDPGIQGPKVRKPATVLDYKTIADARPD